MDIKTFSVALGFIAGAVQLCGYWFYVRRANEHINTGSWSIWAFGGSVELVSFFAYTGDWVVNILPTVCAAAAIGVFVWAWRHKRFSLPTPLDAGFVAADVGITIIWLLTNTRLAYLLFQASASLSFVPMWWGQLRDKEKEDPLPWFVWAGSYSLLAGVVYLRLEHWEELIFPVSHVVTSLIVGAIALYKSRPAR